VNTNAPLDPIPVIIFTSLIALRPVERNAIWLQQLERIA
jgi:hypothetical protein